MRDLIRPDASFTPRELFARMQGAWFEPRTGYMWQENTGVTPTMSGGQTIGKLVDLSADRVASQATAANRPTLQYNGNLPLIRHADSTDVLAAAMPDLGGGVFSSAGSVYFSTTSGMSCLHNQSIGTTYNLPAINTDIYGVVITPARLAPPLEQRLALYMHRLAGLSDADFFWQEDYGPDVVTNGGFDTDNAWDKGLGWSISGGVASVIQNNFAQNLTQECLTAGKVYIITFTITQAANVYNGIRITLDGGTTLSAYYKTPGTYSFTAAATISLLIFQSLYADISIDNISAREVLDGQVGQLLADDDTILLRA